MSDFYTIANGDLDLAGSGTYGMVNSKPTTDSELSKTVWDWQNTYIQSDHTHIAQLAAQPDTTLFFVGPSRMNSSSKTLYPVGYVQGLQATQQRMVQRLYDFGSARAFFTVGKTSGTITLSRLFFKGDNLLASLYMHAIKGAKGGGQEADNSYNTDIFNKAVYTAPYAKSGNTTGFFIDLSSELFLNPFGCGVMYRSKAGHAIGGMYFELCMFNTHMIQMDPNTPQMMENVNVEFDRAIPMTLEDAQALQKKG